MQQSLFVRKQFPLFSSMRWLAGIAILFFAFAGSVATGHTEHMDSREHINMAIFSTEQSCHTMSHSLEMDLTSCVKNTSQQQNEHSPLWCTIECLESSITIPTATTITNLLVLLLLTIIPFLITDIVPTFNIAALSFTYAEPPPQKPAFLSIFKRE